jgi:hypothetical protein
MGCENVNSIKLDQNSCRLRALWSTVLDIVLEGTGKISETWESSKN